MGRDCVLFLPFVSVGPQHRVTPTTYRPGLLVLEFVHCDTVAAITPALPIPARCDPRALVVGRFAAV